MARPSLSLTGSLLGSLLIGERIPNKQPRFYYTCTVCGTPGEGDARHLGKGCKTCVASSEFKRKGLRQVQVLTNDDSFWVPIDKLTVTFREFPAATYYYNAKRVTVVEEPEHLVIGQGDYYGAPLRMMLSKVTEQDLEGQDILTPSMSGGVERAPDTMLVKAKSAAPTEVRSTTPTMDLVKEPYKPPEDALELFRDSHRTWVDGQNNYPVDQTIPAYILAWMNSFPNGTTFREFYNDKQWYGRATLPLVRATDRYAEITDEDDEPSPIKPFVPKLVQSAESKRATLVEDMGEEAVLAMEAAEVQKKIDAQTRKQAFNDFVAGKDLIKR
jgi:hypothetical protein